MPHDLDALARRAGEIDAMVDAMLAEDVPAERLDGLVRRVARMQAVIEDPLMADPEDQQFWRSRLDADADSLAAGIAMRDTQEGRIALAREAIASIERHVASLGLPPREAGQFNGRRERARTSRQNYIRRREWTIRAPGQPG